VLENVYSQTTELTSITPEDLLFWTQNKTLTAAGRRQLTQLGDLKKQLAQLNSEMASNEAEMTSIGKDEDRARQNIRSLSNVSGQQEQVQNYARQLAQLETRITALRDRTAALEKQRTTLQGQINLLIESMNF